MKIQLVSHASVIVRAADACIWTDPWLVGKAFNDSWSLCPEPAWDASLLDEIDFLWISHEHPDHFHIPTLRSLPANFKERVTVLFQRNNSDKMFEAFKRFGFRRFEALPHRKRIQLSSGCEVYCYQEGLMNSCLGVRSGGTLLFNVNDAEIRTPDCKLIVRDIGNADVVLNQFSIAGYSGAPNRDERLRSLAKSILQNVADNHRDLGAKTTIPFASFVYFSTEDNKYVNAYANTVHDVVNFCRERGVDVSVLYPGDVFDTATSYDSAPALERYKRAYERMDSLTYDVPKRVEFSELEAAFHGLVKDVHERYPEALLRLLRPVRVFIPDLNAAVELSLARRTFEPLPKLAEGDADLVVYSQPLLFALKFPYGVQTLGVSARLSLQQHIRNWQAHRVLFALNNAEVYLRPKHLASRRNAEFVLSRMRGGASQFLRRVETMI